MEWSIPAIIEQLLVSGRLKNATCGVTNVGLLAVNLSMRPSSSSQGAVLRAPTVVVIRTKKAKYSSAPTPTRTCAVGAGRDQEPKYVRGPGRWLGRAPQGDLPTKHPQLHSRIRLREPRPNKHMTMRGSVAVAQLRVEHPQRLMACSPPALEATSHMCLHTASRNVFPLGATSVRHGRPPLKAMRPHRS